MILIIIIDQEGQADLIIQDMQNGEDNVLQSTLYNNIISKNDTQLQKLSYKTTQMLIDKIFLVSRKDQIYNKTHFYIHPKSRVVIQMMLSQALSLHHEVTIVIKRVEVNQTRAMITKFESFLKKKVIQIIDKFIFPHIDRLFIDQFFHFKIVKQRLQGQEDWKNVFHVKFDLRKHKKYESWYKQKLFFVITPSMGWFRLKSVSIYFNNKQHEIKPFYLNQIPEYSLDKVKNRKLSRIEEIILQVIESGHKEVFSTQLYERQITFKKN